MVKIYLVKCINRFRRLLRKTRLLFTASASFNLNCFKIINPPDQAIMLINAPSNRLIKPD